MISKLSGYEDLFTYDAKYHRSCYSHYISQRNIKAIKNKLKKTPLQATQPSSKQDENSSDESDDAVDENYCSTENIMHSEKLILHKAAEILKEQMREFQPQQRYFPVPENISQMKFKKPKVLLTFVSWLIDDGAFNNLHNEIAEAVIPCNIIIALSSKIYKKNYFQFELGLFLHHLLRSKQLLDILSKIGLSCTYNDVRQLITTFAKQKISNEQVYIPLGIDMVDQSKITYIHVSMDNFDLNEETIDGKNTTHSMAIVVFQQHTDRNFVYCQKRILFAEYRGA